MSKPFDGLGPIREIVMGRILQLAKVQFSENPAMYRKLHADALCAAPDVMAMVCAIQSPEWTYHALRGEQHILDVRLLGLIQAWQQDQLNSESKNPTPTQLGQRLETPAERQARRYQACINSGLVFSPTGFGHRLRGIGKLAKAEGIGRQAFTEDVLDFFNTR